MTHGLMIFPTRQEARLWLVQNYYDPVTSAPAPGLWWNADGEYVQAFQNCAGGWSVQKWTKPDPHNYIND